MSVYTRLTGLFPIGVAISVADPQMYETALYPAEEVAIFRAVEKRRREFKAGRACARCALARLGGPAVSIPVNPDRSPLWPTGYIGSISHCEGLCCAVVARRNEVASIGLDVEQRSPLLPELIDLVCRPDELEQFEDAGPVSGADWPKIVFCAKEAFYKAYYPLSGEFIDFHDVHLNLSHEPARRGGDFGIRFVNPGRPLTELQWQFVGRWQLVDGYILAGVHVPIDETCRLGLSC